MRSARFLLLYVFIACNTHEPNQSHFKTDTIETLQDSIQGVNDSAEVRSTVVTKTYSNKRFRNVTIQKTGDNKFRIRGEGQIFEANFGWVVEDGHDELHKGFQMTAAGAPEWGKFDFAIEVNKKRENSTLTLILFESSAEDGSRQHELSIVLK